MKITKRRGFTLVELLVVIAILAILATVSVIGYSVFIKKANISADQQAVTQINVLLEGLAQSNEPKDIQSLFEYLQEAGLEAKDYKPLVKDTYFYWDQTLNRVLYVDAAGTVMYPEQYAGTKQDGHYWQSLSGTIPAGSAEIAGTTATVSNNGSAYVDAASKLANGTITTLNIGGTVDCMGASIKPGAAQKGTTASPVTTTIGGTDTANPATLRSAVSTAFAIQHNMNSTSKAGKQYRSGIFFSQIPAGATVRIQNLVLDSIVTGNYETGITGLICGTLSGNLIIENLTIQNCTVYGMNKVGLLAGYMTGDSAQLTVNNLTIENSNVFSSEGEAALLVGMIDATISQNNITIEGFSAKNSAAQVVADQYHQFVTVSSENSITTGIDSTTVAAFKPATTQYITKIEESYAWGRDNGFKKEQKTGADNKKYISLSPCPVGRVLAWQYVTNANYFTAEGLPKVDGKPSAIRHIECFTTVNDAGKLAK